MNRQDIENVFKSLAQGQGFYGRLLNRIADSSEDIVDEFYTILEAKNFKSEVDLILYIENSNYYHFF